MKHHESSKAHPVFITPRPVPAAGLNRDLINFQTLNHPSKALKL
jgi:hypothetical protein